MKVFCFSYKGTYGGGCAVVAANSKEEAYSVLTRHDESMQYYTDTNHCREVLELNTNVSSPRVIICKFYIS